LQHGYDLVKVIGIIDEDSFFYGQASKSYYTIEEGWQEHIPREYIYMALLDAKLSMQDAVERCG
jgi:hypothetical protein